MPRIFTGECNIEPGGSLTVSGDDARHIGYSLRMRPGDDVTVCSGDGRTYECRISRISSDHVSLDVVSEAECDNEPPYKAYLFVGLSKGEKMDHVIQKAVELGVCAVLPFECERAVVRISSQSDREKKAARWRKIAESAAKQCGRSIIPEVSLPLRFDEAVNLASEKDVALICHPGEGTVPLGERLNIKNGKSIAFMTGPEGGFSESEVEKAESCGIERVSLGKRILRCETAPSFLLSCLLYENEIKITE